jgi:hypothetical protein
MTMHDVQAEQTTNVVESLDDLAGFIDREYDLAMREAAEAIEKATSAMQRALVVGAALLRAKAQLRHGCWPARRPRRRWGTTTPTTSTSRRSSWTPTPAASATTAARSA